MIGYTPRRASLRWREEAPDYILDVFDNPNYSDRYDVLIHDSTTPRKGMKDTCISYLSLTSYGTSYWGEFEAHQAMQYRFANGKRRIRWLDLPELVRNAVRRRYEECGS